MGSRLPKQFLPNLHGICMLMTHQSSDIKKSRNPKKCKIRSASFDVDVVLSVIYSN